MSFTHLNNTDWPLYIVLTLLGYFKGSDAQESALNPSHIGDGSARTNNGNGGATSSPETGSVTRVASIDNLFFGCNDIVEKHWRSEKTWMLLRNFIKRKVMFTICFLFVPSFS